MLTLGVRSKSSAPATRSVLPSMRKAPAPSATSSSSCASPASGSATLKNPTTAFDVADSGMVVDDNATTVGASFLLRTATDTTMSRLCPPLSVARIVTSAVGVCSKSNTAAVTRRLPTTEKLAVPTIWKVCVSPASGSTALMVPTVVPIGAFSSTPVPVTVIDVGASLTLATKIGTTTSTNLPARSVARRVGAKAAFASKSIAPVTRKVLPSTTNGPSLVTTRNVCVSPPSGSPEALNVPTTVPSAAFSATGPPLRVTPVGASLRSQIASWMTALAMAPARSTTAISMMASGSVS
jgi:hypothetical protein